MIETCDLYQGAEVYKPMLVLKTPDNASELLKSKEYIAQKKKDGYFYQLVKTAGGEVYLFSRSKSRKTNFYSEKINNVPHIREWAEKVLPNDTILIGEIYYPGKTSKDVTSIMGCLAQNAVNRQRGSYGHIYYYIHDILRYNGEDYVKNEVPFERRYSNLCEYSAINDWEGYSAYIEVAFSKTGFDMEETIYNWMECGEEGAVIKLKSGLYLPGKRRKEMWKIKQHEDSLDFVISGFVAPEKEYTGKEVETWPYWEDGIPVTKAYYYGWKMGFVLSLFDDNNQLQEIGKVTSGLTDEMRADIAQNPNKYFARVAEISCMSVDKDKLSIRHPALIRVRDDDNKDARDCKIKDVFK